jgi:carbonic anhydrase/acetyltransferase-like protein (isoleucine patch superfamily)
MGEVHLGEDASVWFGAVVRGDTARISIGAGTNIQDASVLHADFGQPLVVGERKLTLTVLPDLVTPSTACTKLGVAAA